MSAEALARNLSALPSSEERQGMLVAVEPPEELPGLLRPKDLLCSRLNARAVENSLRSPYAC